MSSITAYGSGARAVSTASSQFTSLKDTLADLQSQMSTGKIAQTYGGLSGTAAAASLDLSARLATLTGYGTTISNAQTRVNLASTNTQQLSTLASNLASTVTSSTVADLAQRGQAQIIAQGDLAEAIDALNTDINGTYIFSGRTTDTQPVASMDTILNGADGLKGLVDVVADRKAADLGSGEGGLKVTSPTTSSLKIASENTTTDVGFVISSMTSSNAAITTATTGTPPASTLNVTAQPNTGDTITLNLTLPDGTTKALTMTAGSSTSDSGDTFAIGSTTDETTANIKTALDKLLTTSANTDLAAASTMRASTDFFAGNYPSDEVVSWYNGDSGTGSARETASVQVGDNQSVAIGLRANETGFATIMAGFGALAVETYTATDDADNVAKYNAIASRASALLTGANGTQAVDQVTTDLANASVTLGNASDRTKATTAQVQDTLSSNTDADTTKVATELLAVQNQLQASYSVTAAIAKLSLTDYMS